MNKYLRPRPHYDNYTFMNYYIINKINKYIDLLLWEAIEAGNTVKTENREK